DIQRLLNDIADLKNRSNNDHEIEQIVREMDQRLERMEQQERRDDPDSTMRLKQLSDDMVDLKARFATIERFALQFSDYLQAKYDEEKEDREYRGTS
ncbi:hypothetical protein KA093_03290, partial [Candidatus Saccharibacteria bacterium]|nr:hypothetical protein [Candidatus Saccharibacteria bacterium]